MLKDWGISAEQLHEDAIIAENKREPFLATMHSVVDQLMFGSEPINILSEADPMQDILMDNLYVLWLVVNYDGPSPEYYERFKRLNYKNKLLITGRGFPINDKMIVKPGFINKGISPGQWAEHKGKNSNKRFIDEVDFAKYFNRIQ